MEPSVLLLEHVLLLDSLEQRQEVPELLLRNESRKFGSSIRVVRELAKDDEYLGLDGRR